MKIVLGIVKSAQKKKSYLEKSHYCNIVTYMVKLKPCLSCCKWLRTALLTEPIMLNSDRNCF